jgi:hypothetical protein
MGSVIGRGVQRRQDNRSQRILFQRLYRSVDDLNEESFLDAFGDYSGFISSLTLWRVVANVEGAWAEGVVPLRLLTDVSNKPTTASASDALRLSTYLFQTDCLEKTVPPRKLDELRRGASSCSDIDTSLMRTPLLELVSNNGRPIPTQNVQKLEGNPGFLPSSSGLSQYWTDNKVFLTSVLIASGLLVVVPIVAPPGWSQNFLAPVLLAPVLLAPLTNFINRLFVLNVATAEPLAL